MDGRLVANFDLKHDALILGNRLIEVAYLAHQRGELDLAKSFQPAAMLDLGNAQQRRDDGQRLVKAGDGLIDNSPQFVQRRGTRTPALKACPHAGERRSQVMGNVVADAGNLLDESFDFAQHPVDADGELIEWIIAPVSRQALA